MPTWKSRGLRGSALEDKINYTIEQYSTKNLALIQKRQGRKSFTYDEIDKTLQIPIKNGVFLHFLEQLQLDLLRHADESNGNGT